MRLHRRFAEDQRPTDLVVGQTARDQPEHLPLPAAQGAQRFWDSLDGRGPAYVLLDPWTNTANCRCRQPVGMMLTLCR